MLRRTAYATLTTLALATASFAANAAVVFTNLGTAAPPSSIGGHVMTPFDQAAQAAIANGTSTTTIPGSPIGGTLGVTPATGKRAIGSGWATWSHGYTGAVYSDYTSTAITLTLPGNTQAFYVYAEPNPFSVFDITVVTNSGATSNAVAVSGASGASGFAFYTTAGETISSLTINSSVNFAFGEFGISGGATCASEGYNGAKLTWCKNICENGLTGQVLDTWIQRWIMQYRTLPYCARVTPPPPPPQAD